MQIPKDQIAKYQQFIILNLKKTSSVNAASQIWEKSERYICRISKYIQINEQWLIFDEDFQVATFAAQINLMCCGQICLFFLFFGITSLQGRRLFTEIQIKRPKSLRWCPPLSNQKLLQTIFALPQTRALPRSRWVLETRRCFTSVLPQSEALNSPCSSPLWHHCSAIRSAFFCILVALCKDGL